MSYNLLPYVTINGNIYAVVQGTYVRKWQRQFTATLSANIVELNFVDRGPGIQTYDMTLALMAFAPSSILYNAGLTQSMATQIANLEADYLQVATAITFLDVYGNPPTGGLTVYFTNLQETVPNFSTPQTPVTYMDVELIAAEPAVG